MKGRIEIHVKETVSVEKSKANRWPRWKRIIAKLLKIPIIPLYYYKIRVTLNYSDSINVGDFCIYGEWQFRCNSKQGVSIELVSIAGMYDNFSPMSSLIIPFSNAFPENRGERKN